MKNLMTRKPAKATSTKPDNTTPVEAKPESPAAVPSTSTSTKNEC